jgi:hypothetical protein
MSLRFVQIRTLSSGEVNADSMMHTYVKARGWQLTFASRLPLYSFVVVGSMKQIDTVREGIAPQLETAGTVGEKEPKKMA